jgi:hypothetical protein
VSGECRPTGFGPCVYDDSDVEDCKDGEGFRRAKVVPCSEASRPTMVWQTRVSCTGPASDPWSLDKTDPARHTNDRWSGRVSPKHRIVVSTGSRIFGTLTALARCGRADRLAYP